MPKEERWVPTGRFRTNGRPVLEKVKVTVLKKGQTPPPPDNFQEELNPVNPTTGKALEAVQPTLPNSDSQSN